MSTIKLPGQRAYVQYTREILENGRVVQSFAPKRNLLLDSGLDLVGVYGWVQCFKYCILGTGTTPTKRDSGNITFTRSGVRVTSSASFFVAADVNRILKMDTGEEMYIRAYVSGTQVDVDKSGALPASEGTVWYVEQTKLDTQTRAISVGSGLDHGTTYDGVTKTERHRRTFLGPVETGNVVYKEIGWSYASSSPAPLLGRDLIPGGGDALVANQQYRVRVDLYITHGPMAPVDTPEMLAEWPGSAGRAQLDAISGEWVIASNGDTGGIQYPLSCAQSGGTAYTLLFLSQSSAAFPANPEYKPSSGLQLAGTAYATTVWRPAYVNGQRKRLLVGTFGGAASGGIELESIKSVGIACGYSAGKVSISSVFRILLNEAQYKDPWWKLTLTFSLSWDRILIN